MTQIIAVLNHKGGVGSLEKGCCREKYDRSKPCGSSATE